MVRKINIPITDATFLGSYLHSINGILGLTGKELGVLEAMIELDRTVTATKELKKELVERLPNVKNVAALTNIIKSLKDKGVLVRNPKGSGYVYNPLVIPKADEIHIKFKLSNVE